MAKINKPKSKSKKPESTIKWFDRPRNVVLICLACLFIYSIYFFNKKKFDDSSFLGGDEWEYQSMAVNYATGHGFPVFGSIEPFEKYKMNTSWSKESFEYYKEQFENEKGHYSFYRTPGYPFYLGTLYKTFGISPKIAKRSQLLMLILVAAFLPFLGFYYWRRAGLVGGIIGGILFLNKYYNSTEELMTEPLITFSIILLLISFMLFEKRKDYLTAAIFGVMMGLGLLIKGSLVYVPVFFFAWLAWQVIKKRLKIFVAAVPMIACALIVIPWSMYATKKEGKTIVLSTQGDEIMLQGNNEATFTDGSWNPKALKTNDSTLFYNQPEIKNLSTTQKVIQFYKKYPNKIPVVVYNKLIAGFEEFIYLKCALILMIAELIFMLILYFIKRNWIQNKNERMWRIVSLVVSVVAGAVFFKIVFLLTATLMLALFVLLTGNISKINMPVCFVMLFLNFLFIVIVILGLPRYTFVIDELFMLIAATFIVLNLEYFFLTKKNSLFLQQIKN